MEDELDDDVAAGAADATFGNRDRKLAFCSVAVLATVVVEDEPTDAMALCVADELAAAA